MRGRLRRTITQNMTRYDQRRPWLAASDAVLQNNKSQCSVTHSFIDLIEKASYRTEKGMQSQIHINRIFYG